jgi:hypothetical protein
MQRQQSKPLGMKTVSNQPVNKVWSSFTMKKVGEAPIKKNIQRQNRTRTNSLTAPTPTSSPMVTPMDLEEAVNESNFVLDGGSSYNMSYEELQSQLIQAGEYIKRLEYENHMLMLMGGWMSAQYVGVVDAFDDYDKELQELIEEQAADEAGVILADEEAAREEFEMEETNDIYEEECKNNEVEKDSGVGVVLKKSTRTAKDVHELLIEKGFKISRIMSQDRHEYTYGNGDVLINFVRPESKNGGHGYMQHALFSKVCLTPEELNFMGVTSTIGIGKAFTWTRLNEILDAYIRQQSVDKTDLDADGWECVMGNKSTQKSKQPTQATQATQPTQPTQKKITSVNSWANLVLYEDSDGE